VGQWWWRFVRFGFRLLYNEMAFTYDWVSYGVSLGAWRCWQRAALKHLNVQPNARILELAHGTGNLQIDLKAAGHRVVGHDLSPYMGRITQRKLTRQGLKPLLTRGQAQKLPFASGSFATVVSTFPTNFIFQPGTLHEVFRVLQSNGNFVIVPNGVLTGDGRAEAGLEWLYRVTGQRGGQEFDIETYLRSYGFEAESAQESCPRSIAQVIIARKKV
jgi:ubiquinone/menaquinone biosynthesis C-methylase UbiE